MSKPGARKTARKNYKRHQKQQKYRHQETHQPPAFIRPTFSGEQVGAPTGAARWFGQKIAALLRFGKS